MVRLRHHLLGNVRGQLDQARWYFINMLSISLKITCFCVTCEFLLTFHFLIQAGKRRNSELDDIRSGGPIRRIRQKSNLLTQVSKQRSEIGSGAQRLLLRNEPDPKGSKAVKENGETSYNNLGHASVPTKSTEMASKIFEQLERMSPKEKPSVSRFTGTTEKLSTKLTSNMSDKVESPKFLPNFQPDAGASTSQSNNKVEENGQKMFAVPCNTLSSMNGNSTVPTEPPQKKRAFKMSAYEVILFYLFGRFL